MTVLAMLENRPWCQPRRAPLSSSALIGQSTDVQLQSAGNVPAVVQTAVATQQGQQSYPLDGNGCTARERSETQQRHFGPIAIPVRIASIYSRINRNTVC